MQTVRHDCCDELGNFRHANISAHHFICKRAQNRWRGFEITSDFYGVDKRIRLTRGLKTKVIYHRIHDPRDFRLSGSACLNDKLFLVGRRRNAHLHAGRIVCSHEITAVPCPKGIDLEGHFSCGSCCSRAARYPGFISLLDQFMFQRLSFPRLPVHLGVLGQLRFPVFCGGNEDQRYQK
jgi:hypothetical protein